MKCRHCKNSKVNRPRGLCWSCYYKPGVREMFPSTSKFARRGLGQLFCDAPIPAAATNAMPGSSDKIAVLAQRVQNQESLWHPQDAGFEMSETMHCQAC